MLDQTANNSRQLGGDCAIGLTRQVGIPRVAAHVAIKLAAQTVLAHAQALWPRPVSVGRRGNIAIASYISGCVIRPKSSAAEAGPMLYLMLRREGWQANHKRVEWLYCEERLADVGSICVEWTPGCGADEDHAKDFDVPKPTISSGRVDATALTPSSVLRIIEGKRGGP